MPESHKKLYQLPELYDIAFDFKDFAAECDFLISLYQDRLNRAPQSWLELAAGPARHSLEMARRGIRPAALDLSGEMVAYGSRLARDAGVEIEYIQADMADFQLSAPVDLAFLPLDSISYLLDNETVYRHLDSVAEALTDNGVYVLEISHPRDMFGVQKATKTGWEMERGGKKVHLVWGTEDDSFDPVSQLTDVSVSVSVSEAGKTTEYISRAKQRSFSCTEIQALVRASGRFELIRMYGAMDAEIDLSDPKAWRMITALQKRP